MQAEALDLESKHRRSVRAGDLLKKTECLRFEATSDVRLFAYVFVEDPTGTVTLLFPIKKDDSERIPPLISTTIPSADCIKLTDVGKESRVHLIVSLYQHDATRLKEWSDRYKLLPTRDLLMERKLIRQKENVHEVAPEIRFTVRGGQVPSCNKTVASIDRAMAILCMSFRPLP